MNNTTAGCTQSLQKYICYKTNLTCCKEFCGGKICLISSTCRRSECSDLKKKNAELSLDNYKHEYQRQDFNDNDKMMHIGDCSVTGNKDKFKSVNDDNNGETKLRSIQESYHYARLREYLRR